MIYIRSNLNASGRFIVRSSKYYFSRVSHASILRIMRALAKRGQAVDVWL